MAEAQQSEPDADLLALGKRIRQLRAARLLSQEDLGHAAGLHPAVVGAIERGERNFKIRKLWQLAEALSVPVADLFE